MEMLVLADLIPRFRNGLLLEKGLKTAVYNHLSYIILNIISNFSCRKRLLPKGENIRGFPLLESSVKNVYTVRQELQLWLVQVLHNIVLSPSRPSFPNYFAKEIRSF